MSPQAENKGMAPILICILSVSMWLIIPLSATGGQKDFTGAWKMDPTRSESAHQAVPVGPMTLVIKQTATEITIETTTKGDRDAPASTETRTYKLDGSENTTVGAAGTQIKTRARWDGQKLVTETLRTVNGMPVTIEHVFTLGAGGKELTIDKTLTVQHGYQSPGGNNVGRGKDVFVRTSSSQKQALPSGRWLSFQRRAYARG
jgi:hypothetical protein